MRTAIRRGTVVLLLEALLLFAPAPLDAGEDSRSAAPTSWSGYLWRDEQGRVRLGWGVIAMGVMARPAYVVDDALAERIAPLVSQVETDYVFWNYSLEEKAAEAATLPVWLVTLEGREVVLDEEEGSSLMRPAGPTRVLEDARLVRAERIPPTWLESWRPVFRAPGSPWRIRLDDPPFDEEAGMAGLAATILDALRAMRAVPAPSEALHHDGGRHLDFS